MGCLHQGNPARRQGLQGRAQQAQLAHAGLLQQEIDQRPGRPTPSRQLLRQLGKAGVDTARTSLGQLGSAPERVMDTLG